MSVSTDKHKKASAPQPDDHLTKLPSEILHMIFDFLFCQHRPDRAFDHDDSIPIITSRCTHYLDYLSATSRSLRAELNDWAIHFLTSHSEITNFEMAKSTNKARTFNMLRGQKGLLTWARSHCIFCGKISSRRAIMMNAFKCCHKCDKVHWPDKITRTIARNEYQLKDHHLLARFRPASVKERVVPKSPLPTIRYGTYLCVGVATTVFLRKDVERVATALHGDLKVYFAKRKANREDKAKQEGEKSGGKEELLPGDMPDCPIVFDD